MVAIFVRLMSVLLCSFGGYRIAVLLNENYILGHPQQVLAIIVGIILGILIGVVLGGMLGRFTANALGSLEASLSTVSSVDIVFGVAGLLVGFLVALFPSMALFRMGYPGYILSIILFVLCGFVGMRVAVLKRPELAGMFNLVGQGGSTGTPTARILDTSVIIDGRVVDIARCGFLEGTMLVPRFVLDELQSVADSGDTLKRSRGRRGLDVLNSLQRLGSVNVEITDQDFPEVLGVDGKLVALSKLTGMPLTTNDFNLNKVAEIQGVKILNINELAGALKPAVLPGEGMKVKIIREGKEPGQGVGYLDDGTMVVVERGKEKIGSVVTVVTTSVLQTPAGKMIFTQLPDSGEE
ncbi:MAG: TRAM domain-containing protein [Actinomycetia bacterium]|nr:TRAM domain-containing protein [Actinomycetes bacterium]